MTFPGPSQHGDRISDQEFERRMRLLVESFPALPSSEEDEEYRRKELDLLIDHRLGVAFPAARRQALWQAHRVVDRRRARLALTHVFRRLISRWFANAGRYLVDFAEREYGQVLEPPELRAFLGVREGERPTLPIDNDQFR